MVVSTQGWKEDSEFRTLHLFVVSDCYLYLQGSTFLLAAWVLRRKLCQYPCGIAECMGMHSLQNAFYFFFSLQQSVKTLKRETVNILMAKILITLNSLLLKQDDVLKINCFFIP